MNTLKPCPFCGGEAILATDKYERFIRCTSPECEAESCRLWAGNWENIDQIDARLIEKWNTRHETPEPTIEPVHIKVKVYCSAGVGNACEDEIEGGFKDASDVWDGAREFAIDSTEFGYLAFVIMPDGTEIEPEEWERLGRPGESA